MVVSNLALAAVSLAAEEGGGGLQIQWSWIVIQAVMLLFLLYFVSRLLLKPVLKILEERKQKIEEGLRAAEEAKSAQLRAHEEYEAALAQARREAQEIVDKAAKLAEDARKEILAESKTEAGKLIEKAREQITLESDRAMAELRAQIADMAVLAAGKVIDRSMDKAAHQKMIDDFISGLKN